MLVTRQAVNTSAHDSLQNTVLPGGKVVETGDWSWRVGDLETWRLGELESWSLGDTLSL